MNLAKKIHLRDGERVLAVVRRYAITYAWKYAFGLAVIFAGGFFMFKFLSFGPWGYAAFAAVILIGLCIVFWAWFFARTNIFIITSERVIDIQRFSWFDEAVSSAGFSDIKDVSVRRRGLFAGLFNYGSVIIQTKSQQFVIEVPAVHSPQAVQSAIAEAAEKYEESRQLATNEAVYNSFLKIVFELPVENLRSVHELIRIRLEKEDGAAAE